MSLLDETFLELQSSPLVRNIYGTEQFDNRNARFSMSKDRSHYETSNGYLYVYPEIKYRFNFSPFPYHLVDMYVSPIRPLSTLSEMQDLMNELLPSFEVDVNPFSEVRKNLIYGSYELTEEIGFDHYWVKRIKDGYTTFRDLEINDTFLKGRIIQDKLNHEDIGIYQGYRKLLRKITVRPLPNEEIALKASKGESIGDRVKLKYFKKYRKRNGKGGLLSLFTRKSGEGNLSNT